MTTPAATPRRLRSFEQRREVTEDGCWLWTGWRNHDGYGVYYSTDRTTFVHRLSYQMFVGEIPEGHTIHHTCQQRACFNPEHLQPLTHREHQFLHRAEACPRCGQSDWYEPKHECRECRRRSRRKGGARDLSK